MVGCAGESEDTSDSGGGGVGDGKITVNSKDANAAPVDRIQYVPVMHLGSFSNDSFSSLILRQSFIRLE